MPHCTDYSHEETLMKTNLWPQSHTEAKSEFYRVQVENLYYEFFYTRPRYRIKLKPFNNFNFYSVNYITISRIFKENRRNLRIKNGIANAVNLVAVYFVGDEPLILSFVQGTVYPVFLQQLLVGTVFSDPVFVDDDDLVCVFYRSQTVGDDKACPSF